jgi:hypothetical protein
MSKTTPRAFFLAALWLPAAILLSTPAQLAADTVTYYYNSLDSNPNDFIGTLTLPSYFPGQPVPILTFSLSAVVNGVTLNFVTADQTGSAEALYDTNPNDPLSLLYPYPGYGLVDPTLGGLELLLGPFTPAPSSLGAPVIFEVPSSPTVVDASDNGVWLLTPPPPPSSTPEPSTLTLFALPISVLGLTYIRRRNRA